MLILLMISWWLELPSVIYVAARRSINLKEAGNITVLNVS